MWISRHMSLKESRPNTHHADQGMASTRTRRTSGPCGGSHIGRWNKLARNASQTESSAHPSSSVAKLLPTVARTVWDYCAAGVGHCGRRIPEGGLGSKRHSCVLHRFHDVSTIQCRWLCASVTSSMSSIVQSKDGRRTGSQSTQDGDMEVFLHFRD